jgi:hypothetical protein
MRPGRLTAFLSIVLAALLVSACSFIPRDAFTARQQAGAMIPGVPEARFWADGSIEELRAFLRGSVLDPQAAGSGAFDMLALSGGSFDGAYGAGVLSGWTAAGGRPKFAVVTGVSTGALIAPLAFIGPEYDPQLKEAFEDGAQILGDIGGITTLLGSSDMRRSSLVSLVDKFLTHRMLAIIAAEHAKGRRLFILTTNLDAQRGVLWDMGAIAARGPDARELFRDILVASASIPGVFAPTFIEAEANGQRFREMHVDGGAVEEVFILPDVVLAYGIRSANGRRLAARVWIVINNHIKPQFEVVEAGVIPTLSRSFSTLIKSSSRHTLFGVKDVVGAGRFNLTYIGTDFSEWLARHPNIEPGFNRPYVEALYRYGYEKALSGSGWTHEVPLPGGQRSR